ncbi:MAG: hypothetical protein U9P50_00395 [Patescibacteria group bacterium]|nr:hypothetical protein [Patescibacteria group bacterium]
MKKNKQRKNTPYAVIIGLIIVLIIIFGIFYRDNQYGTLQIESLNDNLTVFIDNQRKTTSQDINPQFKLKAGKHTVVISKDRFWPWIKEIEVRVERETKIQPFFIPQNTSGAIIGKEDPEYSQIMALFQKEILSEEALSSISSQDVVFKESIISVDFYKDRQDVVIISSGDGIYALEIGSDNIQNFQPIYKGIKPIFAKKDNLSIYVLDNDNLMIVNY